jgi:hypothetical protein
VSRPFAMTRHAAERIQEMCIPPKVIRDVLDNPERTYDAKPTMSRRTPNGPRRIYCKGKVAILVAVETLTILTVLWSGEPYDRNDVGRIWQGGGWIDY